ncbi:hypothetical protein LINPERPRIM_LOCUS2101 [Linum perenne]
MIVLALSLLTPRMRNFSKESASMGYRATSSRGNRGDAGHGCSAPPPLCECYTSAWRLPR